jgi:hypothetical protein
MGVVSVKDNTNRPDKRSGQTNAAGKPVEKTATGLKPGWAARQAAQSNPHMIIEK